ncbi:MAG: hypothetical protein ACO3NK_19190 [Prochlorotrichaceae cyanobacterium]
MIYRARSSFFPSPSLAGRLVGKRHPQQMDDSLCPLCHAITFFPFQWQAQNTKSP